MRSGVVSLVACLLLLASATGCRTADAKPDADSVSAAAFAYLDSGSPADADRFVELAALDGDPRWAPWLLDLLRLGRNNLRSQRIGGALAEMSGIPSEARILDLVAYGGWARRNGLDGGDGYRAFKSGVYGWIDDRFPALLDGVDDEAELAAIQWGGVAFAGIPQLDRPVRVAPEGAPWLTGDEAVLGIEIDGEAVAYPLRILEHHGAGQ